MAFLDILRGRKREEGKPERLSKGALKRPTFARPVRPSGGAAAGKPEKPVKKQTGVSESKGKPKIKTKQSLLAAELLLRPHVTEQSNLLAKKNIYTFRISPSANKILIKKAIRERYGFDPVKISMINVPAKKRHVGGKTGLKPGFKKTMVYLKEGDKIEFV